MNFADTANRIYADNEKNIHLVVLGSIGSIILTLLSYVVANWFGWASIVDINPLEAFAVFTSYLCTWLCVHQTRWNYPIGVITTGAYSWLFLSDPNTLALGVFNLYLVFSLAYGWWRWGSDKDTRPVTLTQPWWWLGYAALALAILGLLTVVHAVLGQEMGPIDVGLAVASGVAQFLLDNKKLETWFVWIVVNTISIPFYAYSGYPIVAFQYVFFWLNAVYGLYEWNKHLVRPINEPDGFDESLKELTFPDTPRVPQQAAVFD